MCIHSRCGETSTTDRSAMLGINCALPHVMAVNIEARTDCTCRLRIRPPSPPASSSPSPSPPPSSPEPSTPNNFFMPQRTPQCLTVSSWTSPPAISAPKAHVTGCDSPLSIRLFCGPGNFSC
ncbi:unnamed protein product [Periconia digitata]|uniref:Uncharacterized protein n=1 Tax=Periconia digitata TaxID=1303443 RepID=A0A9W4XY19_9PLEO|nr:unnamed protein product [Periconia digitata]